jgi:dolichol kinase
MNSELSGGVMYRSEGRTVLLHELVRKAVHLLIAFLPLIAEASMPAAFLLLCLGMAYYLYSEMIRVFYRGVSPVPLYLTAWVRRMTLFAARRQEPQTVMIAPLTLGTGALLSLLLFDHETMRIAVFALAFGDTAAALMGNVMPLKRCGFIPRKSIGGTLGCLAAVVISTYYVTRTWQTALICGAAAAIVELIPLKEYDNISLPLAVGVTALLSVPLF